MESMTIAQVLADKCVTQGIENACLLYSSNEVFGKAMFLVLSDFLISVLVYVGATILSLWCYQKHVIQRVLAKSNISGRFNRGVVTTGLYGLYIAVFGFIPLSMLVRVTLPLLSMSLETVYSPDEAELIFAGVVSNLPAWANVDGIFILDYVYFAISWVVGIA